VISPKEAKKFIVSLVVQSDFQGLPNNIIDIVGEQQCLILAQIRDSLTGNSYGKKTHARRNTGGRRVSLPKLDDDRL